MISRLSLPVLISFVVSLLLTAGLGLLAGGAWSPLTLALASAVLGAVLIAVSGFYFVAAPLQRTLVTLAEAASSKADRQTLEQVGQELPEAISHYYVAALGGNQIAGSVVNQIADNGGRIAIAAAEVSFAADQLKSKVQSQAEEVSNIAGSTSRISETVESVAQHSSESVKLANKTRSVSEQGQSSVGVAVARMQRTSQQAEQAASIISHLETKSKQVENITQVISEIANQTNLLALNAAIEAARAGDQGRGFAVVADEVRTLAQRTTEATTDIGKTIDEINAEIVKVVDNVNILVKDIGESRDATEQIGGLLADILGQSEKVEDRIRGIADVAEGNSAEVEQISSAIRIVSEHLEATQSEVQGMSEQSLRLSEMAELIYEALSDFELGGLHDRMRKVVTKAALDVQQCFEQAISSGRIREADLFDRKYQPIPDTNPVKHSTRFDSFTDDILPAIQEPLLERNQEIAYAGAVDNNGYFPTHNKRFSKPLTGDYQKDLVNNRTKRIFNDRTGSRCGSNTKPFLLQTYKRDTGEIMHDISAPIYIHGKHWGGFRIGYKSDQ